MYSLARKIAECCINFQSILMLLTFCEPIVSSGSKLFAYGTLFVMCGLYFKPSENTIKTHNKMANRLQNAEYSLCILPELLHLSPDNIIPDINFACNFYKISKGLIYMYMYSNIERRKRRTIHVHIYNHPITHTHTCARARRHTWATVLVLIKLTKFAVALRLRCGSCKLIF